jgi:hypothetical protein
MHSSGSVAVAIGPVAQEDRTVAADPDPYYALPKLYGAPSYARPRSVVAQSERPFDPDDLPIAAAQTEEERAYAASQQAAEMGRDSDGAGRSSPDGAASTPAAERGGHGRRFRLLDIAQRVGAGRK